MTDRTLILDPQRMARSIERMAWEIMEHHQDEAVVWVVSISESGYKLAQLLQEHLVKHAKFKSHLVEITINKKNPSKGPTTCSEDIPKGASMVIVDDVLNTGSTLIYAVNHMLQLAAKHITTAVMVDRNHKRYPIKADIKGVSLSTSLRDHVEVDFSKNQAAYLR